MNLPVALLGWPTQRMAAGCTTHCLTLLPLIQPRTADLMPHPTTQGASACIRSKTGLPHPRPKYLICVRNDTGKHATLRLSASILLVGVSVGWPACHAPVPVLLRSHTSAQQIQLLRSEIECGTLPSPAGPKRKSHATKATRLHRP